jgi:hypothetical protein
MVEDSRWRRAREKRSQSLHRSSTARPPGWFALPAHTDRAAAGIPQHLLPLITYNQEEK